MLSTKQIIKRLLFDQLTKNSFNGEDQSPGVKMKVKLVGNLTIEIEFDQINLFDENHH